LNKVLKNQAKDEFKSVEEFKKEIVLGLRKMLYEELMEREFEEVLEYER
jgi:hypothetical protein